MRRSKFYNMRLPERGAREGEANDAADIEDLTYDLGIIDAEMERQRLEDVRLEKDKATKLEMSQHKSAAVLDHPDGSVTDAKLGQRTVLTTSGTLQTLLTAIGNAIKAISGADTWNGTPATTLKDAKTHMDDAVKHITAQEREIWNAAATDRHSHTNKSVLDGITAAMVTAWNTVSSKLPLAGGTLTGFLTLHAAPATDMHAATKKYVDDKMAASGSGDMTKAVYDPGGRELPYIPKQDVDALAWGGDFGASGTPVSIAYAGANRIASITAYGETPQGGTTEAPVALTGVDSVQVCGNNLLPDSAKTVAGDNIRYFYNTDGFLLLKGQAYTLVTNINSSGIYIKSSDDSSEIAVRFQAKSVTYIPDTNVRVFFDVYWFDGVPDGALVWLNLGESPLPYEPYQGSVTPLPIPRPLRRVGYVKDKCVTRVKSVYDKRIVLDGTENWKMGGAVGDGAPHIFCDLLNDHYKSGPLVSSRIPPTSILTSNKNQGIGCWDRSLYLRYDSLFTNVEELKTYLSAHPLTVYYQSTAYDGTNGLDVCLMKYQTGYIESYADESITTAWISSTGALSTGVEVVYVLSSPETYATDPLDIDNAAGPLNVMTGGEVVVRMTELVGTRSPELTAKMDKATYDADGDGVVDRAGSVDGGTY